MTAMQTSGHLSKHASGRGRKKQAHVPPGNQQLNGTSFKKQTVTQLRLQLLIELNL
jgi:hypothetical protein